MGTFADLFEAFLGRDRSTETVGGYRPKHEDRWQSERPASPGFVPPPPPMGGASAQRPSLPRDSYGSRALGPVFPENRTKRTIHSAVDLPPFDKAMTTIGSATLEDLFGEVLKRLDPDPSRQGIAETPARAAKAWRYWCGGYEEDVDAHFKSFEDGAEGYDEMVIVHNIPVLSHCEHHLAAISGIAHVGYIPNGRVVGLSKLARVVDALSRRLQVQERLTVQIADAVERNLQPAGVAVVVKAAHACMSSRGVRIHGSVTTTSALRGVLHEGPARQEFLSLCAAAERKLE